VHCWSDLANVVGGFSAAGFNIARIVLGQRTFPPTHYVSAEEADLYRKAYRVLLRNPAVLCLNNSKASRLEYERWLEVPSGAVRQVYNGFLPSSISLRTGADSVACRARLGLPVHSVVIGGIMRFAPEKDPHLWLEAAAVIAARRSDVHFVLTGYGHDNIAEELWKYGSELGLASRLIMPGPSTDVGEIYAALDVFLMTSRSENIPNVLIEAQAAGVPVVAPAIGGIPEAMLDGVTGQLVPGRSAHALATAVIGLLDGLNGAATSGPRFVAERFDHSRMILETIGVYAGHQSHEGEGIRT
jgi:glycosyltransferase involved in cell wall biosynthesis